MKTLLFVVLFNMADGSQLEGPRVEMEAKDCIEQMEAVWMTPSHAVAVDPHGNEIMFLDAACLPMGSE